MKKVLVTISKGYLGLAALFLGYLGIQWGFVIDERLTSLEISTTTIPAINTLKSVMATALLGIAISCVFFIRKSKNWFYPLVTMMSVMVVVRVVSLLSDGFHGRMAIYAVLEVLIVGALVVVYKHENQNALN